VEDAERARALGAQWRELSDRAFGSALTDPARYQQVGTVAGALHRRLRDLGPGPAVLVEAWDDRAGLLRRLADEDPRMSLPDAVAELAAGAAFAIRHREVLAEIAARDRLARLRADGARPGETPSGTTDPAEHTAVPRWLVLEESGYSAGDPFVAYRRLEAEPRHGRAVLVSTRPDDTLSAAVHEVTPCRVDLETGELLLAGDADVRSFPDETARESFVAAVRRGDAG
jgi:hypothetical protein